MKKEYVERTGLLASLALADHPWSDFEDAYEIVQNAPVEDVAPVVHGEWIASYDGFHDSVTIICSLCGHTGARHFHYCVHCGAKMDGGKHETD